MSSIVCLVLLASKYHLTTGSSIMDIDLFETINEDASIFIPSVDESASFTNDRQINQIETNHWEKMPDPRSDTLSKKSHIRAERILQKGSDNKVKKNKKELPMQKGTKPTSTKKDPSQNNKGPSTTNAGNQNKDKSNTNDNPNTKNKKDKDDPTQTNQNDKTDTKNDKPNTKNDKNNTNNDKKKDDNKDGKSPTLPTCVDSTMRFRFDYKGKVIGRGCAWVSRKDTDERCAVEGIMETCPLTCGTCSSPADSPLRLKFDLDGVPVTRSCEFPARYNTELRCTTIPGMIDTCSVTCGSYE